MRYLRRCGAVVLSVSILLTLCFQVTASSPIVTTVEHFEDGSYIVTSITELPQGDKELFSAVKTKSGIATKKGYNSSNQLMWEFSVHGTFHYDGRSATAIASDYSYHVYHSDWSLDSANSSYYSATATATGTFKHLGLFTQDVTVSISCDADGKLS